MSKPTFYDAPESDRIDVDRAKAALSLMIEVNVARGHLTRNALFNALVTTIAQEAVLSRGGVKEDVDSLVDAVCIQIRDLVGMLLGDPVVQAEAKAHPSMTECQCPACSIRRDAATPSGVKH